MSRRTDTPAPSTLRTRRHRERLRKHTACATADISGDVLNLLVRRGKLDDRLQFTRREIHIALTAYLHEQARE